MSYVNTIKLKNTFDIRNASNIRIIGNLNVFYKYKRKFRNPSFSLVRKFKYICVQICSYSYINGLPEYILNIRIKIKYHFKTNYYVVNFVKDFFFNIKKALTFSTET